MIAYLWFTAICSAAALAIVVGSIERRVRRRTIAAIQDAAVEEFNACHGGLRTGSDEWFMGLARWSVARAREAISDRDMIESEAMIGLAKDTIRTLERRGACL